MPTYLSISRHKSLSIYLSICESIDLSTYPPIYLPIFAIHKFFVFHLTSIVSTVEALFDNPLIDFLLARLMPLETYISAVPVSYHDFVVPKFTPVDYSLVF